MYKLVSEFTKLVRAYRVH